MSDLINPKATSPSLSVEHVRHLEKQDIRDLCDATDEAIKSGGGFGWVELPPRETLERYWQGVMVMPGRELFVARLDGVICGTCQLVKPPMSNHAQKFFSHLTTTFVAPWARSRGLGKLLVKAVEEEALKQGFSVINLDLRETLTEAIKLYEVMGYVRIGEHPCYAKIDGKVLKGYYYYKVVDPKVFEQGV